MSTHKELSQQQAAALVCISTHLENHGRPPSFREIGLALKVKSTNTVSHHLVGLKQKGLIKCDRNVARGLSLTEEGRLLLGQPVRPVEAGSELVPVGIWGYVQAGLPVDPGDLSDKPDEMDTIAVQAALLPRKQDNFFALRVRGWSMIDALVGEGDIVVLQQVRENREVRNGEMVAAWLPLRQETTLKHFFQEGRMTRLQPANPDFEPIILPSDDVVVQGKVILVQRRF